MARNGAGVYSKLNTFSSGATITASGHNQNWDDLVTEMTNSVAADGQTTITGQLKGAVGSAAAPSYSFSSDLDTGIYHKGANEIGVAVNGTLVMDISTTGVVLTPALSLASVDVDGGTALTGPATGDELPIYDLSATTNKKITLSNLLTIVNSLTADTTPDTAADYVMTYDSSASAVKKVLLQLLPWPRGFIDGCILSNNGTDATNDIDIAAGACRDSTNTVNIICAAMTKQLDVGWAAGTATGYRDTAAAITDTTYHIYAVAKADGTQDYYATTQATASGALTHLQAETGGSGYAYARRIGSIIRSGGAILSFIQTGDYFRLSSIVSNTNSALSATAALQSVTVPSGIRVESDLVVAADAAGGAATSYYLVSDPSATDQTPSSTLFTVGIVATNGGRDSARVRVFTNTSAQVRHRASSAQGNGYIASYGWVDQRGKNS